MARYTKWERYMTTEGICERKGEYLVDYGKPVSCAEVLTQCITRYVHGLSEPQIGESPEETAERYELIRDYMAVLDFMMAQMENEVLPALKRLREKEAKMKLEKQARKIAEEQESEESNGGLEI